MEFRVWTRVSIVCFCKFIQYDIIQNILLNNFKLINLNQNLYVDIVYYLTLKYVPLLTVPTGPQLYAICQTNKLLIDDHPKK